MQLPGPGVMGPPRDRDEALAVLRRAVELGVDHVDTAQFYGPDVANELIREALHPYPDDLALVSKVGAGRDAAGAWLPAQRPEELRAASRTTCAPSASTGSARSTCGCMDAGHDVPADQLVPLRRPAGRDGRAARRGQDRRRRPVQRDAGPGADGRRGRPRIACVQNPFSLVDQHDADVLDLCAGLGIAYVPFFPLGSAFPGMPKVSEDPRVRAVAERRGATPAQVGLAWLLALPRRTCC